MTVSMKMFKTKKVLRILAIVLIVTHAIIPHANAGELFTLLDFSFTTHKNAQDELIYYALWIIVALDDPDNLDKLTIKDPNDDIIHEVGLEEMEPIYDNFGTGFNFGTDPPLFGTYTITVTNKSGDPLSESEYVNTVSSDLSSGAPVILTPDDSSTIDDKTPTLSWEPFESPEHVEGEPLSYRIEIAQTGPYNQIWAVGLTDNVTSVIYNFDGTAEPGFEELIPGNYSFLLFAYEAIDEGGPKTRTSIRSINFNVSEPIPTLTEWGMIIFMTVMMGIGVVILRKIRMV